MFSCEIFENFQNRFSAGHLWTAASVYWRDFYKCSWNCTIIIFIKLDIIIYFSFSRSLFLLLASIFPNTVVPDCWYKDRRVAHQMATRDNERQQVVQRVTTKNKEWQWQRMATSGTTNGNEWQQVVILANFPLFLMREETATKDPKENS